MKTKIVEFNGYKYRVANEWSGMVKVDEYTLTACGTVKKFAHQNCLWLEGCPKILESNDPALKGILPDLQPSKRLVWLNMNTGEFSNSWGVDEYKGESFSPQYLIKDGNENWKLLEYFCYNDDDFEFFNLMQIMTNVKNLNKK